MIKPNQIRWLLLGHAHPIAVDEPLGVYRLISITQNSNSTKILVDDHIEDPATTEFFVVLKDLDKHEWLCYYDGQYVYCGRLTLHTTKING